MSAPAARLPERLRPREREPDDRGARRVRLLETAILVLVGLLLAVATVNDVARQTAVNHRLIADIRTWRQYTGHAFHNVSVDQQLLGPASGREVVCGNDAPGPPKQRVQICLVVRGPVHGGVRRVVAGWYLPAHTEDDVRSKRYGCFGPVGARFCTR
jgi:hypothetical protein